jgi:hypothetical protein
VAAEGDWKKEQQSAAVQQMQQRLLPLAIASRDSYNTAAAAKGRPPPNVSAMAFLRMASDDEQQMADMAQLLQPGLDQELQRQGVPPNMIIISDHYTQVCCGPAQRVLLTRLLESYTT